METVKVKIYNFLRWSEKYVKTDMVYLTKGGFWLTSGQIVSSIASFALALAFANLLPKEVYGTYQYILSLAGMLTALTLTGMNSAVTQAVARNFEGTLNKSFWVQLKWGLILLAVSLAAAGYYFIKGNSLLAFSLLIIGLLLPLSTSANTYGALLTGKKEFKTSTLYGIITTCFYAVSMLAAIIFSKQALWLVLGNLGANTLANVFFYYKTIKKFKPNKEVETEAISYGKHLSLISFIGGIATYLDGVLIFHFLGAASLAIYSLAAAPTNQIQSLLKNLPSLALPKLAQRSFKEISSILYKRLLLLFLVGVGIALIYSIIAPYFFKIAFPKYLDSIFFSQLFSITIILRLPTLFLSSAGQSKLTVSPKKYFYWGGILPNIVLALSLLLLTKFFGLIGAIISQIIFLIFNLIINLILWKKASDKFYKNEQRPLAGQAIEN